MWSNELAVVAQNFTELCVYGHNNFRHSQQSTFLNVGENLAADVGAANYTVFIQNWYDENAYYNYSSNSCSFGCDNYTQVYN